MSKINKNILSACAIIVFFIMAFSSNPSKKSFQNADKWIPADFNPDKTTLLVQRFSVSARAQQKMEDYMAEKYPYKYEFVDLKTIKERTGKYADTKMYKYALVITSSTSHITKAEGATTSAGITTTGFDYNFLDRETNKNYPGTKKPSSYAIVTFKPVINSIVKHFE